MSKSHFTTIRLAATWVSAVAGTLLCWNNTSLSAAAKQRLIADHPLNRAPNRIESDPRAIEFSSKSVSEKGFKGEQRFGAKDVQPAASSMTAKSDGPTVELDSILEAPSMSPATSRVSPLRPTQTPNRQLLENPDDQVAPPGLNVEPGNYPINPYLSLAMQQELDNLVGRFESALFRAASANQTADLGASSLDPKLTASAADSDMGGLGGEIIRHPVLAEAQRLILDWPELIEQRSYSEARQRWLAVRQALWDNFPIDQPFAQPEIRAMWLDRGAIVQAGSRRQLAEIFDRLAAAGINTVFFETVNAGYPIYPSRVAPQQNPLTRHWDPLRAAVDLAHERNMELHAWVWAFAAGNQLHNTILNLPTHYPGPLINSHPDWAGYDNQGNMIPRGQTKPFLDPANPEVRNYLLRLLAEMVNNYDLDGIQLDYIRYPFQDPGQIAPMVTALPLVNNLCG